MLADICAATDLVAAKNLERNPTPLQKDGRVFCSAKPEPLQDDTSNQQAVLLNKPN